METVINNPGGGSGESSGMGMIVGVILAIVIIVLFFMYGLPAIRSNQAADDNGSVDINVELPSGQDNEPAPAGGPAY